jgi:hypothetical protein
MPISYDMSDDEFKSLFSKVNALVFPGGFWEIFEDSENEIEFNELALGAKRMLNIAI